MSNSETTILVTKIAAAITQMAWASDVHSMEQKRFHPNVDSEIATTDATKFGPSHWWLAQSRPFRPRS